ncbi:DUF2306 domain-containing protein [Microbispora bryophytorum]|uniref:DUF2306 domain-containing protein n=1 Tax=Microbispora bryophytorum subsp. camponoti TaxID=1677852 RepID=A0ABR8L2T4_9ACTN|nr:DUF2306 domain-containing protein [Microbispora camponoti]MBD3144267.1 DUF2306 domain-containing protein [Microbispora camponoti]
MRRRTAWVIFIVAVIATTVLVYPYLGLDIDDSRLDVRDSLHYYVLVGHIGTAAVALVLGSLQFMPSVRARRRVHRALGRVYLLAGVLPSAVATIPVALWSGRLMTQIGLTTAAVLWLISGGLAYRAARRRDFDSHRNWMMRNYALTFLAVTARVIVPLLLLVQIPFRGADPGSMGELATSMIPIGQTLGWVVNLVVVETIIRRRQRLPEARRMELLS